MDSLKVQSSLKPLIKWVGGKRQLLPRLRPLLPETFGTYFEPFIGGGALLFALEPHKAVINDANEQLISMYQVVKNNPNELIQKLEEHAQNNSKEYYLKVREYDRNGTFENMDDTARAARLIYMLRVDFNGLYRVNSKGQFNVPYGKYKSPKIADSETIMKLSNYFNRSEVTFYTGDFKVAVENAKPGDLVYFDPPYIPLTETSSFTSYTANGFGYDDQVRLKNTFFELADNGVQVMLSNSDTPITRDLYKDATIHQVSANRAINAVGSKRGKVNEVIVTSY